MNFQNREGFSVPLFAIRVFQLWPDDESIHHSAQPPSIYSYLHASADKWKIYTQTYKIVLIFYTFVCAVSYKNKSPMTNKTVLLDSQCLFLFFKNSVSSISEVLCLTALSQVFHLHFSITFE